MEISLDKINSRSEPYQLFLDSIRSSETLRRYKTHLHSFLKLIPNQVYVESLGKTPSDREAITLAKFFVELARKDMDLASDVIAAFIKEDKKRVTSGEISSQTIPNHIKPIKVLLDANRVPIHWKSLYKLLPRREAKSKDRAYTKEEIQKMLEVVTDITDKVLILMFSSGGFRLEAWDYFTWKDVIFFKNDDGTYKGAALLIYRGDPESYFTFITPETCKALEIYCESWKKDIGVYPKPDDPLIKTVSTPMIRRLAQKGVRKRIDKIVSDIGLRPPLPPGVRRHEVQLDHGFRKYFNTMLRRAKVDYLDKEDMMGHKVGLEKHYERYNEEDFERFPEYQKAIPFLTISDEERIRLENERLDKINSEIKSQIKKREESSKYPPITKLGKIFSGIDPSAFSQLNLSSLNMPRNYDRYNIAKEKLIIEKAKENNLKSQKDLLEDEKSDLSVPTNLKRGIIFTFIAAIFGIIMPSMYQFFGYPIPSIIGLVGFLISLVLMFSYFAYEFTKEQFTINQTFAKI